MEANIIQITNSCKARMLGCKLSFSFACEY
jgi:hypothetical protein